jgi:glycosyltransferase involved in cell wall biosynthesis
MTPRVSVVIPCHDDGVHLEEAVSSVLAQSFDDFEIVVADDGSSDEATARVLRSLDRSRTTVLRLAHGGVARARNEAIREARGEYVLPLDADDRIAAAHLEKTTAVLDAGPEVGIVDCEADLCGEASGPWLRPPFSMPELLLGNTIAPCSLFRRADFERTRGYDPGMRDGWEDFDLWLSILELGRSVARVPDTLLHYRVRRGSRSDLMGRRRWPAAYRRLLWNHPALYARHPTILPRLLWKLVVP